MEESRGANRLSISFTQCEPADKQIAGHAVTGPIQTRLLQPPQHDRREAALAGLVAGA